MKRSHGSYSKQSRNLRSKGRLVVRKLLASYSEGQAVRLSASPGTKNGRPHLRFHNLVGKVVGRQGRAYRVSVRTGDKLKTLVVSNEHLEKV